MFSHWRWESWPGLLPGDHTTVEFHVISMHFTLLCRAPSQSIFRKNGYTSNDYQNKGRTLAHSPTRRSLVQGTAWAIPAIAVANAAPALAASPTTCAPSLGFSGGLTYGWGTVGSTSTTQTLQVGGQTYVNNLPAGVKVASVTYKFWIQNRQGQTSPGPGAFWMGNSTASTKGSCSTGGCTATWTPTAGSGFSGTVTNTANNSAQVYPNGTSYPSWDINMSWSSSKAPGTYTANGSCSNFTTGPSGKFGVTYTGVVGPTTAGAATSVVNSFVIVTATLSNGQILTATVQAG